MIKVLKFGAAWCGPCRMINPIVEKVAGVYTDVDFVSVDIDQDGPLAQQYKIASVPTLVFEVDGKEVHRLTGVLREEGFKQILDKLLQK